MKKTLKPIAETRSQQGVTAVVIAIMMTVFIGIAALAIDIGHLYVVRNELQNAADAGALAGARVLYTGSGSDISVNTGANEIARLAAVSNKSENLAVEVNTSGTDNEGDVQRGHWSFTTRQFTSNASTTMVDLWAEGLDTNPAFINAVKVTTRRATMPAASFFARIFGYQDFAVSASAVAYIGFVGTIGPHVADLPIGICKQKLLDGSTCTVGRLINSASGGTSETGGWTDFCQADTPGCDGTPCQGGTNASILQFDIFNKSGGSPTKCSDLNPYGIKIGQPVAMENGQSQVVFDLLRQCWVGATNRTQPWEVTLPVVACDGGSVSPCEKVVGYVSVNVLWVTDAGANSCSFSPTNLPPLTMGDWTCETPTSYIGCWNSFVNHFNLMKSDGMPATYENGGCMAKTMYFMPDCEVQQPTGTTGGGDFGILAEIPVLVQ